MQGEGVEQSIIQALNRINAVSDEFDCVVIIRGGGATSDMSGFDTLALAENVANFPLPIITGIGHERDESILDMISFQRVKTPTAAAEFLISHLSEVLEVINDSQERITRLFSIVKTRQEAKIDTLYNQISMILMRNIAEKRHRLEMLEEKTRSLDPQILLKRGYSITLHNGKAVRDPQQLQKGDEIETRIEKGTIKSIIQ